MRNPEDIQTEILALSDEKLQPLYVRALATVLGPDEVLRGFALGVMHWPDDARNGALVPTNERLIFLWLKMFGRFRVMEFYYPTLLSQSYETGFASSTIQLSAGGVDYVLKKVSNALAVKICKVIRERINA